MSSPVATITPSALMPELINRSTSVKHWASDNEYLAAASDSLYRSVSTTAHTLTLSGCFSAYSRYLRALFPIPIAQMLTIRSILYKYSTNIPDISLRHTVTYTRVMPHKKNSGRDEPAGIRYIIGQKLSSCSLFCLHGLFRHGVRHGRHVMSGPDPVPELKQLRHLR